MSSELPAAPSAPRSRRVDVAHAALARAVRASGLTQAELADRVEMSRSAMNRLVTGQARRCRLDTLSRIAREVGVPVAALEDRSVVRGSRDDQYRPSVVLEQIEALLARVGVASDPGSVMLPLPVEVDAWRYVLLEPQPVLTDSTMATEPRRPGDALPGERARVGRAIAELLSGVLSPAASQDRPLARHAAPLGRLLVALWRELAAVTRCRDVIARRARARALPTRRAEQSEDGFALELRYELSQAEVERRAVLQAREDLDAAIRAELRGDGAEDALLDFVRQLRDLPSARAAAEVRDAQLEPPLFARP